MSSEPLVSIITPTYNCRQDLLRTLAGIRSQRCHDFELIIIDGGSKDGTVLAAQENQDLISEWISEPDAGIYDAMNKGISRARGTYLQFLNAGDLFYSEDTLSVVQDSLYRDSPDALFGRFHVTDLAYNTIYDLGPKPFNKKNLAYFGTATVNHQAMYVRRSVAPKYSLRYKLKGELNWYFDIVDNTPDLSCLYLDVPLVKYKVGGAGNLAYKRNLYEWICLIQGRCGTIQNIKNIGRYRAFLRYNSYVKKFYA